MSTSELRVYTLRTKDALDYYREQIYPRHLSSFPPFGIEATASGSQRKTSSHNSSCWSPARRAKNPARWLGGICKARNLTRTFGTLMYPTSLGLNRPSSYRQQVPL
jgi:primosomal protein N'